jgi:hypothetical protein
MTTHSLSEASSLRASARRGRGLRVLNRHFVRHYVEMLVVMFLGMAVLGLPADAALLAIGTSSGEFSDDAPALMLLGMAFIMTVPMVAWMRYRGHGWRASMEMAASMFIPTFGVMATLWGGLVEDSATLLAVEHAVMLPSMLVAMLLRHEEYSSGGVHGRARHRQEAAA